MPPSNMYLASTILAPCYLRALIAVSIISISRAIRELQVASMSMSMSMSMNTAPTVPDVNPGKISVAISNLALSIAIVN